MQLGTCINGTDYPSWMIETEEYKRLYIFHEPQGCCEFWFGDFGESSGCVSNVVQGDYDASITVSTNRTADLLEKWYPLLEQRRCVKDGATPTWMLSETFTLDEYFHESASHRRSLGSDIVRDSQGINWLTYEPESSNPAEK
eukprot:scaffold29369_cov57-Cyclotella_meneghiniana.AAC.13